MRFRDLENGERFRFAGEGRVQAKVTETCYREADCYMREGLGMERVWDTNVNVYRPLGSEE